MVFRPELSWEFLSLDEINAKSVRAMRNHVRHLKEVSPYYRDQLRHIDPAAIQTLDDIQLLPLTEKQTLCERTELFLATPPDHIVETVVTSGSTGKPLIFGMTGSDLDRLAFNEALCFYGAGVTQMDRVQLLVSLDRLFIAGMAYYRGLTNLGANTARVGVMPFEMQRQYLELLRPTVLVGVPSFLRKLAQDLLNQGFDTRNSGVERVVCIGESIRDESMQLNALGRSIEEMWRAQVFSTYGSTELSVAYCECTSQHGGHAHPELVYTEIVDEEGRPVEDGTPGELVATPLGVEGMPLLRYRTGDICFKMSEPCSCGRNACRIGPVLARKSQMFKIRGTTVYPLAVTNALDEFEMIEDYVVLLEGDSSLSDQVTIHAAVSPVHVPAIADCLRAKARVSIPILVSNVKTVESLRGPSRKKVRIVDKRVGSLSYETFEPK